MKEALLPIFSIVLSIALIPIAWSWPRTVGWLGTLILCTLMVAVATNVVALIVVVRRARRRSRADSRAAR